MSPLDVAEETALLSLLGALAFSYVLDRLHLFAHRRRIRRTIDVLNGLEARLQSQGDLDRERVAAELHALERRVTSASKKLISWRSSPVEHWIIGRHIDTLLFEYERAGAMATRLLALLSRRSSPDAPSWVTHAHAQQPRGREQAGVSARP